MKETLTVTGGTIPKGYCRTVTVTLPDWLKADNPVVADLAIRQFFTDVRNAARTLPMPGDKLRAVAKSNPELASELSRLAEEADTSAHKARSFSVHGLELKASAIKPVKKKS